ncbi:MAG: hypothetical protein K2P14_10240 [Anaeroplasmataceae bacterium]|nr:hypothetical protein [Anaeroplasmataceae bacterium]
MEQLIQKYIRYFYITLIGIIFIQLVDITVIALKKEIRLEMFVQMFLSIINLIMLGDSMKHNIKQQFTECKQNARVLRITLPILIIVQALLCFEQGNNWMIFGNYIMLAIIIKIILNYRIKSIEYLEELAKKFAKDNILK